MKSPLANLDEKRDAFLSLKQHPAYVSGRSVTGKFYEGMFDAALTSTAIIIPGDCFGSWAYRLFAERLHAEKRVNVFLFNLSNGYRSPSGDGSSVDNLTYVTDIVELYATIEKQFAVTPDRTTFIGHSRGAHLVRLLPSTLLQSGHHYLVAPLLKVKHQISIELLYVRYFLKKPAFYLPRRRFDARFFGVKSKRVDSDNAYYELSHPVYRSVILSKESIPSHNEGQPLVWSILSFRDDRAVPIPVLKKRHKRLRIVTGCKWELREIPGSHCEIINNPSALLANLSFSNQ